MYGIYLIYSNYYIWIANILSEIDSSKQKKGVKPSSIFFKYSTTINRNVSNLSREYKRFIESKSK